MALFDLSRIVAPMVNQSDAPFRSLCLKYGATCVYTEMIDSQRIVHEESYLDYSLPEEDHRLQEFGYQTHPLVVQICGNDPYVLTEAVEAIAKTGRADAVDFNLGCPQERAKLGLFGSYLLDKCHWPLVFDCVRAMVLALRKYDLPLFCKIRLIHGSNNFDLTKQFCFGLYDCGVRVICIHGRTRGSTKHRRVGAADLATIGRISADLEIYHHQSQHNQIQIGPPLVWDHQVVVIANGNITSPGDLLRNTKILQESCGSDVTIDSTALPRPVGGFMSAEGILKDPAIFYRYQQLLQESSTVTFAATPSLFELFAEYCKISDLYYSLNGWDGFNLLEGKKYFPHTICPCDHNNSASQEYENRHEEKNLRVARQHLNWMLGKSGHGRLIRYEYLAKAFRRHTDQMDAINGCTNIQELLQIAESAFLSQSLEA